MTVTLTKAPADILDYDVRFYRWLTEGDTIASATATITGEGAAVDQVENSEQTVKVWVSGGTPDETYGVTVLAQTHAGRTKQVCFRIAVKDCC